VESAEAGFDIRRCSFDTRFHLTDRRIICRPAIFLAAARIYAIFRRLTARAPEIKS
jgi:hypothetical protein